jgi:hypothetical protein
MNITKRKMLTPNLNYSVKFYGKLYLLFSRYSWINQCSAEIQASRSFIFGGLFSNEKEKKNSFYLKKKDKKKNNFLCLFKKCRNKAKCTAKTSHIFHVWQIQFYICFYAYFRRHAWKHYIESRLFAIFCHITLIVLDGC